MAKFRRKKSFRYDSIEVGVPPLETTPKKFYPSFPPEVGSFNQDKFQRSANTFSDKDFQLLNRFSESDAYTVEIYKNAILAGVDMFKRRAIENKWAAKPSTNEVYARGIKKAFRDFKDPFTVRNTPPQDWDQFFNIYGPTKLFNLITQLFEYFYLVFTREQIPSSFFVYYYFYYYFYFTEYNLENVYLYFPVLRIFFSNQIFSSVEGVYFSFFEIVLGFFIPALLLFLFSQYQNLKLFFPNKVYFIIGISIFFSTLVLPFIYYFTGYSTLFIFIFFFIFFSTISVVYIFEYSSFGYFDKFEFKTFSTYYLPVVPEKKNMLFLPIYFYKFNNWPTTKVQSSKPSSNFTKFPFTINIKSVSDHNKRLIKFRINEYSFSLVKKNSFIAPTITISGLVFPQIPNSFSYSIRSHRDFIQFYPQKRFAPLNESQDHDYYDELERDYFPIFVRDFMNHPDGYSQVSFLEFISKNQSLKSFDFQFNNAYDEHFDFYHSAPSTRALQYLYPYFFLKIWLNSIGEIDPVQQFMDDDFRFIDIKFIESNKQIESNARIPVLAPIFLVRAIDNFFFKLTNFLDRITFFAFKKFPTSNSTFEILETMKSLNKILIESKTLSPIYYKNIFVFISRTIYRLNKTYISFENLSIRQIFTYSLLMQIIEEIYFNVNQRVQYLDNLSLEYKVGNFFLIKLRNKLDGFSQFKI